MQDRLQELIRTRHHGELLVGAAEIVETGNLRIPYIIAAPTMRVPMVLTDTVNPYLAARAVLLLVKHGVVPSGALAGESVAAAVESVAFPGLGTGVGRVGPNTWLVRSGRPSRRSCWAAAIIPALGRRRSSGTSSCTLTACAIFSVGSQVAKLVLCLYVLHFLNHCLTPEGAGMPRVTICVDVGIPEQAAVDAWLERWRTGCRSYPRTRGVGVAWIFTAWKPHRTRSMNYRPRCSHRASGRAFSRSAPI